MGSLMESDLPAKPNRRARPGNGGARPGSGPKPAPPDQQTERVFLTLPRALAEQLRAMVVMQRGRKPDFSELAECLEHWRRHKGLS